MMPILSPCRNLYSVLECQVQLGSPLPTLLIATCTSPVRSPSPAKVSTLAAATMSRSAAPLLAIEKH